jgi:hypothetical protein
MAGRQVYKHTARHSGVVNEEGRVQFQEKVPPSARGSLESAKARKSLRHASAVLGECSCAFSRRM